MLVERYRNILSRGPLSIPFFEAISTASNFHKKTNMSDPQKPGAKAIPEWQREKPSDAAANPQKGSLESSNKPGDANPGSRAILIEQASRFLEDPEIKHSTMERKIQFLESKGLTNHEIFEMMGIARKEDTPTVAEPEDKTEKVFTYNPCLRQ